MLTFLCALNHSASALSAQEITAHTEKKTVQLAYQDDLMRLFLANFTTNLPTRSSYQSYCQLPAYSCNRGILSTVAYIHKEIEQLNLAYAPSTIFHFEVRYCAQHYAIDARHVPRAARIFRMGHNRIFGRINLADLPDTMQDFRMEFNQITGPIDLTRLPRDLRYLDLYQNRIKQPVLYYGNLPENLKKVMIEAMHGSISVGRYEAVNFKDEEKWKSVFFPAK